MSRSLILAVLEHHDRAEDGRHDGHEQCEGRGREGEVGGVHTVEAEDHGRDGHDDGDDGQAPHDDVQIVRDDRPERLDHRGDDPRIDIAHLDRLPHLDQDVLEEVLVLVIELDRAPAQELLDRDLIGLEGGGEVHEGLLELEHLDQLLVLHRAAELLLHDGAGLVDLLEVLEVDGGDAEQELHHEARLHPGLDALDDAVGHVAQDAVAAQGDGEDIVLGDDDAERDGKEEDGLLRLHLADGGVDDDERLVVLTLDTRGLLLIEGGAHEAAV